MYGYGSSARVGVDGKRGHGGRNYRPPKPRKDPNTAPPPLKFCQCLLQFDLPEYFEVSPAGGARAHAAFLGGRQGLEQLEGDLRFFHQVHLVVPGRKQTGPVAIVGSAYHQALPAALWFLDKLVDDEDVISEIVTGRIQRNVKNSLDSILEGQWRRVRKSGNNSDNASPMPEPFWLFRSSKWNVLACPLSAMGTSERETETKTMNESEKKDDDDYPMLTLLKTCIDNLVFSADKNALEGLDYFTHNYPPTAFSVGNPEQTQLVCQLVRRTLQEKQQTESGGES